MAIGIAALTAALAFAEVPAAEAAEKTSGERCATASAARSRGACAPCRTSLTASGFADRNPAARAVGTTVGQRVRLRARVTNCRLPARAQIEIRYQLLDNLGYRRGPVRRHRCRTGARTCVYNVNRRTAGGAVFWVVLRRCRGSRRSRTLDVVWAPPAPSPPAGTPPASGAAVLRLVNVYRPADGQPDRANCQTPDSVPPASGGEWTANWRDQGGRVADYKWSLPATVTAGASANLTITGKDPAGGSGWYAGGFGFIPGSEFGMDPAPFSADAQVGPGSSATGGKSFSLQPSPVVAGARAFVRVNVANCGAFVYEYVAS